MPVILHSDLNCFYASVEMNEDPALRGRKVAVCGSTENRHGIVLTASYPAKRCGVKTGMANWQAKQACPDLLMVPPHYDLYLKYSRTVRGIYRRYSSTLEPFGMDENWIDLPHLGDDVRGEGLRTAEAIRAAVREETGLTVSIGVSFTKIFAKLGSDMKKPDAVTLIDRGDFRERIWPLPVSELLYVGPKTTKKLHAMNIRTIGELACCNPDILRSRFGKNGLMLRAFANGEDGAPVMPEGYAPPVKSVGHGATCIRDLESEAEVWPVLYELAQDVGHRLRANRLTARAVQLFVRDRELCWLEWQQPLRYPSRSPLELAQAAFDLFRTRYPWDKPVRSLTVRGIQLARDDLPLQLDLFNDYAPHDRRRAADDAVDELRRRFGPRIVTAASLLQPPGLADDRCETVPMPGLMYRA